MTVQTDTSTTVLASTGAGVTRPAERPTLASRYAERSVAPCAREAVGARLRTRGLIRLGRAWWPYRGHEVTLPAHGYLRELRVAGGLRIVDSWVAGRARRDTTLWGRHVHPALVGPDLARADLAHAVLSVMWVPPVLVDPDAARWTVEGRDTASVAFVVGGRPASLRLALHRGLPRQVTTLRWGDPENDGHHREVPFGADVLEHRTFGGLTVPATGVLGWRIGTPGPVRELLRFQITALEPVTGCGPVPRELSGDGGLGGMSADAAEGEC